MIIDEENSKNTNSYSYDVIVLYYSLYEVDYSISN